MKKDIERKFLTINDIQREYLPISHKKLRAWVKEDLPVKYIGRRIYVERAELEALLSSGEQTSGSLD